MKTQKTNSFSPIFEMRPVRCRCCDWAGCSAMADYRAPKSRDHLRDYFWFCLEHVRIYNAEWDYLAGLSERQIEGEIREAAVWERPTRKLGEALKAEQLLRDAVLRTFRAGEEDPHVVAPEFRPGIGEEDALAVLGLVRPITFPPIKARYRLLAKRHHPDANGGSAEAVEKIKNINQAFALLRTLYEPHNETQDEG